MDYIYLCLIGIFTLAGCFVGYLLGVFDKKRRKSKRPVCELRYIGCLNEPIAKVLIADRTYHACPLCYEQWKKLNDMREIYTIIKQIAKSKGKIKAEPEISSKPKKNKSKGMQALDKKETLL